MEFMLEIRNWIDIDENGGVGYVLPLTSWNLKSLSLRKFMYLFRDIYFGLCGGVAAPLGFMLPQFGLKCHGS